METEEGLCSLWSLQSPPVVTSAWLVSRRGHIPGKEGPCLEQVERNLRCLSWLPGRGSTYSHYPSQLGRGI